MEQGSQLWRWWKWEAVLRLEELREVSKCRWGHSCQFRWTRSRLIRWTGGCSDAGLNVLVVMNAVGNHSVLIVRFCRLINFSSEQRYRCTIKFSSDRKTGFGAVKIVTLPDYRVPAPRVLFTRFPVPYLRAAAVFASLHVPYRWVTVPYHWFSFLYRWVSVPSLSKVILYFLITEPAVWVKPSSDGATQMQVLLGNAMVKVQVATFWSQS